MTSELQSLIDRCVAFADTPGARTEVQLRSGRRDQVARNWEEELRGSPGDFNLWRRLAVLGYWDARSFEASGSSDEAITHWSKAINCWAVLLASDDFWRMWATERAIPCGILRQDLESVRRTVMTRLEVDGTVEPGLVSNYVSAVSSVRRGVRKHMEDHFVLHSAHESPDGPYHRLSWCWTREMTAAGLLNTLKLINRIASHPRALPDNLAEWIVRQLDSSGADLQPVLNTACVMLNLSDDGGEPPSCGPQMAGDLGIAPRIAAFAARFREMHASDPAVATLLEHARRIAGMLSVYMHPLYGKLLAWIDIGWNERCTLELKDLIIHTSVADGQRELQKLLCFACHEQARRLVTNHDFGGAVSAMETAEQFGAQAFRNAAPFEYRMDGMKDRICEAIQDAAGRDKLRREAARDLVRRLGQVGGTSAVCARLEAALAS